jgi:predicted secreted hydrolase
LRQKDNKVDNNSSGTFVYKDGTYRSLKKEDFSIKVIDYWVSNNTNIKYPSKWKLKIPSENINAIVTPYINNQELLLDFTYWKVQ